MSNLLDRARQVLPGGVSSPVRAFRGVGGTPVFVRAAAGAYLEDPSGRRYIDYIGGYGPQILGHAHPEVVAAIREAAGRGSAFGTPTVAEVELGELIVAALPAAEMVRFVSSGTEATMTALRLARAVTGRTRMIKLAGCYHGHADPFLVAAGSGAATIGVPSSPGVPAAVTADTLVAPYNDLEAVERLFRDHGDEVAALFVEPVAGNMGLVPPEPGYLEGLRELCTEAGALLVFDEVMTGFRLAWGGAQTLLGVGPDLTTLGKVIGGGLPVGAVAGPRGLLERLAPEGDVYQAGTLSGNPLAMAAGLAVLRHLEARCDEVYLRLEATAAGLASGLEDTAASVGVALVVQRRGSMLSIFFTDGPVRHVGDVDASDLKLFARVFHHLLDEGVHLPPSAYETMFVSTAHGDEEVEATVAAFATALGRATAP